MNTKAKTGKAAVAGGVVALAAGLVGTTVLVSRLAAETPESTGVGQQEPAPAYHYTGPTDRDLSQDWFDGVRSRVVDGRPAYWRRLIDEVDDPTPISSGQDDDSSAPTDDGSLEYDQIALGGLAGVTITAVVARTVARRRRYPAKRDEDEDGTTDLAPEPNRLQESEFDLHGEILESARPPRK